MKHKPAGSRAGTSRVLTVEEAFHLINGPVKVPAGGGLRSAAEILQPYLNPETWEEMLEDITDSQLKVSLMKWVDTLKQSKKLGSNG